MKNLIRILNVWRTIQVYIIICNVKSKNLIWEEIFYWGRLSENSDKLTQENNK